jgi:hypothetical protein
VTDFTPGRIIAGLQAGLRRGVGRHVDATGAILVPAAMSARRNPDGGGVGRMNFDPPTGWRRQRPDPRSLGLPDALKLSFAPQVGLEIGEHPMRTFELVINLRAAKALGLAAAIDRSVTTRLPAPCRPKKSKQV